MVSTFNSLGYSEDVAVIVVARRAMSRQSRWRGRTCFGVCTLIQTPTSF